MAELTYPVGMHPDLEQPEYFPNLHASLCVYIRDWLSPRLPEHYLLAVEQGLSMTDPFGEEQTYRPDVRIDRAAVAPSSQPQVAVLEPPAFEVSLPTFTQRLLTIRDQDRSLITTIEILSPANKRKSGPEQFARKQHDLARQGVHLVEIDLLRQGLRRIDDERVKAADYLFTVQRAEGGVASCWRARLGETLPAIPIPLRYPDADVPLPLETILREFMTKSGLARRLA